MPAVGRLAWLVQLGQGGFYTYEGLENLVGCQFRNVMGIRAELQQLPAGDTIVLHGRSGFGPEVVSLNPERALVLGGPPNEMGSQATWGFYLLEDTDGTTRLLKRGRGVYSATARAARSRRSSRTARPATKPCTRPTSMSSPAPASRR